MERGGQVGVGRGRSAIGEWDACAGAFAGCAVARGVARSESVDWSRCECECGRWRWRGDECGWDEGGVGVSNGAGAAGTGDGGGWECTGGCRRGSRRSWCWCWWARRGRRRSGRLGRRCVKTVTRCAANTTDGSNYGCRRDRPICRGVTHRVSPALSKLLRTAVYTSLRVVLPTVRSVNAYSFRISKKKEIEWSRNNDAAPLGAGASNPDSDPATDARIAVTPKGKISFSTADETCAVLTSSSTRRLLCYTLLRSTGFSRPPSYPRRCDPPCPCPSPRNPDAAYVPTKPRGCGASPQQERGKTMPPQQHPRRSCRASINPDLVKRERING